MTPSRKPSTNEPTVTVSVRMPKALKESLQTLAAADERTVNWYVVRALTDHVETTEK